MKNPQNSQYFGDFRPYPLELHEYHRFIIPNYQNSVTDNNLSIWVVNEKESFKILAVCKVGSGILKYVTFRSDREISGRLEIRDSNNEPIFYSNCIQFLDSTDENGRKFIKVATKHTYNRNLFDFQGDHSWIVTNLPAYSLGLNSVEAEINNARTGGNSTLKTRETYIDELTEYEFIAGGDSNVLNFIQVHVTNDEFYIDETKRTSIDKIDRDEFSISGKIKLTNVKDKNGFNIPLNPEIIIDIYDSIYADNVTYSFTYSHEPIDTTNEGQWFLTNLLFNNYHNAFGITYDCDLKIKLFGIPVKGFLANNLTRQIYQVGDIISYCDKDKLVYFPNGFDNDLGVAGNYIELFTYKIIDQEDRIGRLISHTISMADSAVEPIDISVSISWNDDSSAPKSGNLTNITVKLASLIFDPADPIILQEWEIWDGSAWIFYKTKTTDSEILNLSYLDNRIRLKVVSQFSITAYSNVLSYAKSAVDNLYITDVISDEFGNNCMKVHVEGGTFTGFVNITGEKDRLAKNAVVDANLGNPLFIPDAYKIGDIARNSTPITLTAGVHDFNLSMFGVSSVHGSNIIGQIGFGYTTIYEDSLATETFTLVINP